MSAFNIARVGKQLLENKKFSSVQIKQPRLKAGLNFINRLSKASKGKYYEIYPLKISL
jgi:hypothetical protein